MVEEGWRIAGASVAGTSHLATGSPCQDAHRSVLFPADGKPVLTIAVSDGAGTARAGEIGSKIAVDAICEQVQAWFETCQTPGQIDRTLACGWLDGVREQIADRAAEAEADMRDYACTLLVAVLTEEHAAFFQIGDGAIVCRDQEPEWSWVFWPQHGPYVNTTFFVTEDCARERLEFSASSNRITEIAVFSDGLENLALHHPTRSTYDPFFDRMFKPLRSSDVVGCDQSLSELLQDYLSSPAVGERTNDDVTLVLASRVSPEPIAVSPIASEPAHGSSD